jgi:hypothetical protein
MKTNKNQKIHIKIIATTLLLSCLIIILTTPIHEATHWVLSDIDPYIDPIEFHLFDERAIQNGKHMLSSALGCVVVKESYPGAFKDRPQWADLLQEIICISIQIIITCIIVTKILSHVFKKRQPNPQIA